MTWSTGVRAVLPADADSIDPGVSLNSVSCPSAGNCAAVGTYYDSADNEIQGVLLNEVSGQWSAGVEASLPANALAKGGGVTLPSVSCASAGNCAAVGTYLDASGYQDGLLLNEVSGVWSKGIEAALPANGAPSLRTYVASVSCPSAGNCVAVGGYETPVPINTYIGEGLLLTETSGHWGTGVEAALPGTPPPGDGLTAVSCPSAGNCAAVGEGILHFDESSGTWGGGVSSTLPTNAATDFGWSLTGLSCPSAGNCAVAGNYVDDVAFPELYQGWTLNESSSHWEASADEASLPADASPDPFSVSYDDHEYPRIESVSCASAGNCAAVGAYPNDSTGDLQGLLLDEASGTWHTGAKASLPANSNPEPEPMLTSVSCASAGNCAAVGSYFDSAGTREGLLLGEASSQWSSDVEAGLPSDAATDPAVGLTAVSCPSTGSCAAVGHYSVNNGFNHPLGTQGLLLTSSSGAAQTYALSVSKTGTGSGTVTSSPAGISCGSTCSHDYAGGTQVTLSAAAAAGSSFGGWSGAGCSGTATCKVTMSAAKSVTATFSKASPPSPCIVPKVTGKSLTAAKHAIATHNCGLGTVKHAFSRTVKKGRVLSQKPKPQTRLKHGGKVSLVLSKGKKP